MPSITVDDTLDLYYEDDCFADPWTTPETIVLIHGVGESSAAWYGWVPGLSRRFRVLRPDLRGFGRSTVPAPGYGWSPANHAADIRAFLDELGIEKAHIVGAKYGGAVATQFAADFPDRVLTLDLMGPLIKGDNTGSQVEISTYATIVEEQGGHAGFAVNTQRLRLGSTAPAELVDWWNRMMIDSPDHVGTEIVGAAGGVDLTSVLGKILAPTLVITTDRNPIHGLEWVVTWQRLLKNSDLVVLPGDGYHVAASDPDECVRHVTAFIERRRSASA